MTIPSETMTITLALRIREVKELLPFNYKNILGDICDLTTWQGFFLATLVELALNRFRWKNLPQEIDPRMMELNTVRAGSVVFFLDEIKGYCALPGAWEGIDYQGNPTNYNVVTPTELSPRLDMEEGVIIWNNFLRMSDFPTLYFLSNKIAEVYQTAEINTRGQKHPIVVLVDEESQRLTLENAYAKLDGNHPIIYLKNKGGLLDKFQTIDAKVPFIAPELMEIANYYMELALKWLGIKIPNVSKRNKVGTMEQRDTNAVTWQLRNRGLHSRQIAAEQINRKFGLDLEVEFDEEGVESYASLLLDSMGQIAYREEAQEES